MRKISDTEWTDISMDERRVIDLVDYLCEKGMSLDEALHWLVMLPPVLKELLKDDTFRGHLEDEYTPGDMMLQRFAENEPTCTGYQNEPTRRSWFHRLVRFDQALRHWWEGLWALDPYDGKTGLRIEDEDEWRDLYS